MTHTAPTRPDFSWLNEDSRLFLERGYLLDGTTPENRIRAIAADILHHHTDLPAEKIRDLFCNESGYQTPKLDTRAAIIEDDKILLVQERDCRWALPGGWVDVNCSVRENITKEVKEEAGLDVVAERILALHDWHQHNGSTSAWHICKIFIQCRVLGGAFQPNNETLASGWFRADALPPLIGKAIWYGEH